MCTGARLQPVNEPRAVTRVEIVNRSRAVGLSYEEQNFKNDERNCGAVGRATRHGIMKPKLSADTKRFSEVRQRALEANLDNRRAVGL